MTLLSRLFPSATFEDLRLYFNQTLVWAKPVGSKDFALWAVLDMMSSGNSGSLQMSRDFSNPPEIHNPNSVEIEVKFPETGYMNWRSTAVQISRRSRRQNQKGLCNNTVSIENYFGGFLSLVVPNPYFKLLDKYTFSQSRHGLSPDGTGFLQHLHELLTNPEPITSFDSAWEKLSKKLHPTLGRAIGRKFAMSKSMRGEYPTIWYDGIPVGHANSRESIVVSQGDCSMFYQEVTDFFQPQGIEVSVEQ